MEKPVFRRLSSMSFKPITTLLSSLETKALENIVGKGVNAGTQHFLLFPHFSTFPNTNFNFSAKSNLSSANAFNLNQFKNLSFGKQLR